MNVCSREQSKTVSQVSECHHRRDQDRLHACLVFVTHAACLQGHLTSSNNDRIYDHHIISLSLSDCCVCHYGCHYILVSVNLLHHLPQGSDLWWCELQGQGCPLINRGKLWQRQRLQWVTSTACFLWWQAWSNQLPGTCLVTSLSLSSLHAVHMHIHQAAAAVRYIPYL